MIRRPPRSTLDRSSAASDVYKRQTKYEASIYLSLTGSLPYTALELSRLLHLPRTTIYDPVSYTHLRAHETVLDLVCRLLLEKKKKKEIKKKHQTRQQVLKN